MSRLTPKDLLKGETPVQRMRRINAANSHKIRRRRKADLARGPVCRKCEIEKDIGYCRCERAANH